MCLSWAYWRIFNIFRKGVTRGSGKLHIKRYTGMMYSSATRNIHVHVMPHFLEGQSKPEEEKYVWAYTITVENRSAETVTLRSRYWKITDAFGRVQEVRGDGVVGEQPTLKPGENFQYTSGCPLSTPTGFMVGSPMPCGTIQPPAWPPVSKAFAPSCKRS